MKNIFNYVIKHILYTTSRKKKLKSIEYNEINHIERVTINMEI